MPDEVVADILLSFEDMDNSTFYDVDWKVIHPSDVLGRGGNRLVILRDGIAVKVPLRTGDEEETTKSVEAIHHEQKVYKRLSSVVRITPVIRIYPKETHLSFMKNGSLEDLLKHVHPSTEGQLEWFIEIARTVSKIHLMRTLLRDIHSGNILMDDNWKPIICDFGEAKLFRITTPVEDMEDESGYTIKDDICSLGHLYHEIIVGHLRHMPNEFLQAMLETDECPGRVKLQLLGHGSLTQLEMGIEEIMQKCQKCEYKWVDDIVEDLRKLRY